jgi:hypothetical protein
MKQWEIEGFGIGFEANTFWEAQRKAIKAMRNTGIKKARLLRHFKNGSQAVTTIQFP